MQLIKIFGTISICLQTFHIPDFLFNVQCSVQCSVVCLRVSASVQRYFSFENPIYGLLHFCCKEGKSKFWMYTLWNIRVRRMQPGREREGSIGIIFNPIFNQPNLKRITYFNFIKFWIWINVVDMNILSPCLSLSHT